MKMLLPPPWEQLQVFDIYRAKLESYKGDSVHSTISKCLV